MLSKYLGITATGTTEGALVPPHHELARNTAGQWGTKFTEIYSKLANMAVTRRPTNFKGQPNCTFLSAA